MQFFSRMHRHAMLFLFVLCFFQASAQKIRVCSWNLKDFGQSKTEQEISFIANLLKSYDVLAIQEVVAGYGGPKAVIRLTEALNRSGTQWEYTLVMELPATATARKGMPLSGRVANSKR